MAIRVEQRIIGETVYETTTFTTSGGIRLVRSLIKVAGPSMALMFEGDSEYSISDEGPITKAVKLLAENIDKEDIIVLLKALLANTTRDGVPINFDMDFSGNYEEMLAVLFFVIQENFSGFFAGTVFAKKA